MRLVQWVPKRLLIGLWKYSAKVDVKEALERVGRIGLWESPTGLMFFDPPVAGDDRFYRSFYGEFGGCSRLTGSDIVREEFRLAAGAIGAGARVLDVGCGSGAFRKQIPQARYTGLDPHFGGVEQDVQVLPETLEDHLFRMSEPYDVVCAFQVLEHVVDPLGFAERALRALKPGGTFIIGVPLWPSPNTTVPNFVLNCPPHHITWWTDGALRALADRLGLEGCSVTPVPMSRHEALIYWMATLSPVKCRRDRFYAHRAAWHASLALSYWVGRILERIVPPPGASRANALLMTARKPQSA